MVHWISLQEEHTVDSQTESHIDLHCILNLTLNCKDNEKSYFCKCCSYMIIEKVQALTGRRTCITRGVWSEPVILSIHKPCFPRWRHIVRPSQLCAQNRISKNSLKRQKFKPHCGKPPKTIYRRPRTRLGNALKFQTETWYPICINTTIKLEVQSSTLQKQELVNWSFKYIQFS